MAVTKKAAPKKRSAASVKASSVPVATSRVAKKPAAKGKKASTSAQAFERERRSTLLMAIFVALSMIFASLVFYWYA